MAALIQAITGVRALAPSGTLARWVAYAANIATVGAGVLAGLLTPAGLVAALKAKQ